VYETIDVRWLASGAWCLAGNCKRNNRKERKDKGSRQEKRKQKEEEEKKDEKKDENERKSGNVCGSMRIERTT